MTRYLLASVTWAVLSCPTPALGVQAQPSSYDAGVAARLAGEHAQAITLLRQAVASEPENADAHLQLGLALMAAGRGDEAERAFQRTLELAPDYQDAKDALERLEKSRFAISSEAYRWQADLDGAHSSVAGAQPDWLDIVVQLRRRFDGGTTLAAIVEPSRRFGRTDTYAELRVEQQLSGRASAWASIGGAPEADFRAKLQLAAGGSVPVTKGAYATVLTGEARLANYPAGRIATLSPGIEQYVGRGSWLTGRMINIFAEGKRYSGWLARGDWMASERVRLFAGAANAPDADEGVVRRVSSLFAGMAVDVSGRSRIRISLAKEDRNDGADRTQLALGMGVRF